MDGLHLPNILSRPPADARPFPFREGTAGEC